MKYLKDLKLKELNNVISLAVFGSYGTDFFKDGISDIDILVLIKCRDDVMDEFDVEEELIPILKDYFEYDDIHLTFITMKDYDTIFANQYIDSTDKLILDHYKEIDFRIYINKYNRENEWLDNKINKDLKLMEENRDGSLL